MPEVKDVPGERLALVYNLGRPEEKLLLVIVISDSDKNSLLRDDRLTRQALRVNVKETT